MLKTMLWAMLSLALATLGYTAVTSFSAWEKNNRTERKKMALDRQMKAEPRIQDLGEGEVVSTSKALGQTGLTSTVVKRSDGSIMSAWALSSTQTLTVGQKVQIARVECGGNETGICSSNNGAYWILTSK